MVAVSILVGALIALISGLGIGGGGLFAVYLSIFTDIPQLAVQGYNLLFFLFSAGASVIVQLFKRKIPFLAVGIMIAGGVIGALLGTAVAGRLPSGLLRKIFGIMLISGGIVSLKKLTSQNYSNNPSSKSAHKRQGATSVGANADEKSINGQ